MQLVHHLSLYSMSFSTFERDPSNFISSSMSKSRTFPTLGLQVILPVISSPSQTVIGSLSNRRKNERSQRSLPYASKPSKP
ncbi:hypothetical protein ACHAXM_006327, partial [Skeletonema potamos]